jgi:hypothetical protein
MEHISFWLNLLEDNIDTINDKAEFLIDVSKVVALEINLEKTKYMLLSRHQNVCQNRDIKISYRSIKNVSQFKYLRTTVTNQNLIQEEFKGEFNSVQNLLSSRLLLRDLKIKIYKNIIVSVVLCACETLFLTLREEHRLRVFENRVLRRIFGPRRNEVTGGWRKLYNVELRDLYSSPRIIGMIKPGRMR